MLAGEKDQAALAKAANDTQKQMEDVEYQLLSKPLAATDDKTYISAWKVYYNLVWLEAEIGPGAGDVAGGAEFAPTDSEYAQLKDLEQKLGKAEADYKHLMTNTLPAFNRTLLKNNIAPISAAASPRGM
jgi:hypothetical protein